MRKALMMMKLKTADTNAECPTIEVQQNPTLHIARKQKRVKMFLKCQTSKRKFVAFCENESRHENCLAKSNLMMGLPSLNFKSTSHKVKNAE